MLTLIEKTAKSISHYDDHYNRLSEYVHPNGLGIQSPYVKIDRSKMEATYSKSIHNIPKSLVLPLVIGSLKVFISSKLTPTSEVVVEMQQLAAEIKELARAATE